MRPADIPDAFAALREAVRAWERPVVEHLAADTGDAYKVLIATLLSLRTKDEALVDVVPRLFALATTPEQMVQLSPEAIERAIYPVLYYRNKARTLIEVSRLLLERHGGRVPGTLDELLALPGVGLKTANLVLGIVFHQPAICVDTHVHRITNRWGLIATRSPDESEAALRAVLPVAYWIEINRLLVPFGKNLCFPTVPQCSACPIHRYCDRVGVVRSR